MNRKHKSKNQMKNEHVWQHEYKWKQENQKTVYKKKHENCLQHEHVNAKSMNTEIQIRKMKTEIQMKKKREKNEKHNERKQELSQIWKKLIFLETFSCSCHVFFIETHIEFWSSLIMRLCMLKLFLCWLCRRFQDRYTFRGQFSGTAFDYWQMVHATSTGDCAGLDGGHPSILATNHRHGGRV